MPGRKAKPPRLSTRRDRDGRRVWIIRDRGRQIRTGCGLEDIAGAEKALANHIASKHRPTVGERDPAAIEVADVIAAYAIAKDPRSADPYLKARYDDLLAKLDTLNSWWGGKKLAEVIKSNCEAYVDWRIAQPRKGAKNPEAKAKPISVETARHELSIFRSAISDYHAEHVLNAVPVVTMPAKSDSRERFLTRHEAARMLGAVLGFVWDNETENWKRENGKLFRRDRVTRTRRRHIGRFFLIGIYSARRERTIRRTLRMTSVSNPWFDLDKMIYHGRGADERRTKKRRPPASIAHRLRPHLLRWSRMDDELGKKLGISVQHIVHRPDGGPVKNRIKTGWYGVVKDAGLGKDVVCHVTRHTAATWMMQAGTDMWQAAGFLAMSMQTLQDVYGHHHPDFQADAAEAYGGGRKQ